MDDLRKIAERASEKAPGPWTFGWEEEPENAPEDFWPWGVITHHEGSAEIVLATSTPGGIARQPDPIGEYIAAVSPDVVLNLIDQNQLDAAWANAVDALPEGWAINTLKRGDVYSLSPDGGKATWEGDGWTATASSRENMSLEKSAHGETPTGALVNLTAVLRSHD